MENQISQLEFLLIKDLKVGIFLSYLTLEQSLHRNTAHMNVRMGKKTQNRIDCQ